MTNDTYKAVRSLNLHVGRLAAIKYIRTVCGCPFAVACMAADDIISNKRWTKPEIKADLNDWPQGFDVEI